MYSAALFALLAFAAGPLSAPGCGPDGPTTCICGAQNVEGLVALRGTTWVIGRP